MASLQRIDDGRSAAALADLLNGKSRRRPVVVVTIPAGQDEPWIDIEEIVREAGDLAEIYAMRTGEPTWEFSHRMAQGTQVYGGAGRVYPVGHEWAADLSKSPLRFAFNANDGERATQQLISDTLRMAASAGLLHARPTGGLRQVKGNVKMTVAGRALVDIGNLMPAAIAEELTAQDVPIDRLVEVGQLVEGLYDPETNRIDVTQGLRPASDALTYAPGDVILAKVARVCDAKAELVLYPKTSTPPVSVSVLRADVTTNPFDDLRTLMTVGEIIRARVIAPAPQWALVLKDVDDDESIVDAPSLLSGGPPWLVEEPEEVKVEEQPLAPPAPLPRPTASTVPSVEVPPVLEATAPVPSRPSPAMLDKNSLRSAPPPAVAHAKALQPAESTKTLLLKIDGLAAEVRGMTRDRDNLRTQVLAGADEREQLRYLLEQAERRANRAENDLKAARARLRKAGGSKSGPVSAEGPQFADPEQRFRYLVLTQWATRTLPSEQAERPLPNYLIGPRFLDSIAKTEGIKEDKIAGVAFEIVTGLAPQVPSREVHHLRTGSGGADPIRRRDDGAIAWRASLQVNTPSARRIHYWVLPDGQIELARVGTHDDFDI